MGSRVLRLTQNVVMHILLWFSGNNSTSHWKQILMVKRIER